MYLLTDTGTDTVNSLRSPASANSLYSIRPTRGLISRAGVIPISYTQDTLGPIARTIKDAAVALTVMASIGYDARDNTTALIPASEVGKDYSSSIYGGNLKGLRVGVLQGFYNRTSSSETTPINVVMDETAAIMRSAGAILVPINETVYNATAIGRLDVQQAEFREAMDAYLGDPGLEGEHPASLQELYDSGDFVVLPSGYNYVNNSLRSSTSNSSYAINHFAIRNLTLTLRATFTRNKLDAIIYPEQKNLVVKVGSPSQSGRNGILAALTGYPVVTVPAGFSSPSETAPIGIPIGMEILGLPWQEDKLINIAARLDDLMHVRRMPSYANGTVEVPQYTEVPTIMPNRSTIPSAYPVGSLGL
jgi:Asp-tRNA(Asn)/Glu-tRNA(Gln) amidotransferase A subunit family amidase